MSHPDLHYDYEGNPIGYEEWCGLWSMRLEGWSRWRIARTEGEDYTLSTVWTGLDLGRDSEGRPLIFETEVQDAAGSPELHTRYATEADAMAGHEIWVRILAEAGGLCAYRMTSRR